MPSRLPVVSRVPPFLEDGTPFPTTYWLSCPLAVRRIGRIEATGGVAEMEDRAASDTEFGERLTAAHARYGAERDAMGGAVDGPHPTGGVGGRCRGVKCLHAPLRRLPPPVTTTLSVRRLPAGSSR